jgi:hypothetical protein
MVASVIGSSHQRSSRPNQDAAGVKAVDSPIAGVVAAISDGHGGTRYVRSDIGSRLAVGVALEAGRVLLEELPLDADADAALRSAPSFLGSRVVDEWKRQVLEHVAATPFTNEERERGGTRVDADPLVSYGATLIVAVATAEYVVAAQLGDGDLVVAVDDEALDPIPGDDRLIGGETTSLCLPGAAADMRFGAVDGRATMVLLASDGYGNAFAESEWHAGVARDFARSLAEHGGSWVAERLEHWLGESARVGGDDVSMVLMHRAPRDITEHVPETQAQSPDICG